MSHWAYDLWHKYLKGEITVEELIRLTDSKQTEFKYSEGCPKC